MAAGLTSCTAWGFWAHFPVHTAQESARGRPAGGQGLRQRPPFCCSPLLPDSASDPHPGGRAPRRGAEGRPAPVCGSPFPGMPQATCKGGRRVQMKHDKRKAFSSWVLKQIFHSPQPQGGFLCVLFVTVTKGTRSTCWKHSECHQNILEIKAKKPPKTFNPKTTHNQLLCLEKKKIKKR